jgi:hypothetical protein
MVQGIASHLMPNVVKMQQNIQVITPPFVEVEKERLLSGHFAIRVRTVIFYHLGGLDLYPVTL